VAVAAMLGNRRPNRPQLAAFRQMLRYDLPTKESAKPEVCYFFTKTQDEEPQDDEAGACPLSTGDLGRRRG
jgi:hypothetical protein